MNKTCLNHPLLGLSKKAQSLGHRLNNLVISFGLTLPPSLTNREGFNA